MYSSTNLFVVLGLLAIYWTFRQYNGYFQIGLLEHIFKFFSTKITQSEIAISSGIKVHLLEITMLLSKLLSLFTVPQEENIKVAISLLPHQHLLFGFSSVCSANIESTLFLYLCVYLCRDMLKNTYL